MSKNILFEKKEDIGIITINSPETNNAFNKEMLSNWLDILIKYKKDNEVKGLILTGKGRVFCSGGNVEDMVNGKMSGWEMKKFLTDYVHKIALEMETFYKPVVAAINGAAIGAGLDMSLMCDFRIASEKAVLSEAYIKLGLIAGDGGCFFLPRIVGRQKALELLLTGKILKANEALEWGLVDKVVAHDELLEQSIMFLQKIIRWPSEAVQLMKKMIYASEHQTLRDHLSEISSHMGMLSMKEEFIASAKKILNKAVNKS